jgi:hypothetical protein
LQQALDCGIAGVPADVEVGIIAITATDAAARSRGSMPHAIADGESEH